MENAVIRFRAKGQNLSLVSGYNRFAGNTIGYIRIEIEPDDEWRDFDAVDALFQNDQGKVSAVLFYDSGVYACNAPVEMTAASSVVFLNLSGKNVVNNVLVERLTTYPIFAFAIDRSANVTSYRETEVSPNMYEQYIAAVGNQVEKITDLTVSAHEADEPEVIKTAVPGLPINLDFGLVRGETGEQGIPGEPGVQGEPGEPGEKGDPFTYDDFTEEQLAALVGPQGPKGSTGDPAGFGNVTAEIDNSVGTPSVEVATAGPDTAKNIHFTFSNLKGVHGDPIDVQIDGESIVSDSVANIPKANLNDWGVVKTATATLLAENYSYTKLTHMSGASEVVRNLAPMSLASFTQRGLMSKDDKVKLAHIASGAEVNVQSDWNQTDTSADDYIKNKPTLADVAMSGSYSDLEDTPTLADVAISGSYNDLADTPSIPTKVSDLENDVPYAEEASLKSALPTDTASGSIASFPDGTDLFPALSVKAQIEPIQSGSGTPSPTNVRPISGRTEVVTQRTGKNLFDGTLLNGYYDADNNGAFVSSANWRATNKMRCKPSTTYVMSGTSYSGGSYNGRSFFWDMNGNYLGARGTGANFTSYPNSAYMALYFSVSYVTDAIQIEEGSTATDYDPYQGNTYTTTLGRTVYGGTLDVVSGELVVTHGYVDMGTLNWSYVSSGGFFTAYNDSYKPIENTGVVPNLICSQYTSASMNQIYASADKVVGTGSVGNYNGRFVVKDSAYTDATAFKTAMDGVQLCYELATPQTYQLDPQTIDLLLGDNNVWTDCGAVEVTYKADVGLYIDKKFAELQALVLEQ